MYDLQIKWESGGLTCTGVLLYEPTDRRTAVCTEGRPFDGVPLLRLPKQTISKFESASEGVLWLQFSNGDQLTITREHCFESFTIHQQGQPIIVGR